MIPLPNVERVCNYFAWRQEDAHRNSLNAHCYWALRRDGKSVREATAELSGKGTSFKNEFLFQHGINYNDLPKWQKRGIGVYFRSVEKQGFDPKTNETTTTERRELYTEQDLPIGVSGVRR